MASEPLPSEFLPFGHVVGRVIRAVGDTDADPDTDPEAIPVVGKGLVRFTPLELTRVVTGTVPSTWVQQETIAADLDSEGFLALSGERGLLLWPGVWKVSAGSASAFSFPSFTIEVTAAHTADAPLDLWTVAPYSPPSGATVTTLVVPAGAAAGQVLGWDGSQLVWEAPPEDGAPGKPGHSPVLTWQGDQLAVDGVVSGPHLTGPAVSDAGFRDIRSLLATGWTATALKVRRWGAVVHLVAVGLTAGSGATTNVLTTPLPVGFRPPHTIPVTGSVSGGVGCITATNGGQITGATTTNTFSGTAVWTTTDTWPTALPGVVFDNLLTNGGFENNFTGWKITVPGWTTSTNAPPEGALFAYCSTAGSQITQTVEAFETMRLTMQSAVLTGSEGHIVVTPNTGQPVDIPIPVRASGWGAWSQDITMPADATTAQIAIICTTGTVRVDAIILTAA